VVLCVIVVDLVVRIVVVLLCVLLYCVCIAVFLVFYMPDCWIEVSTWKVLRPAISTQVFLGFPVSISKC
jgi:hypothetical protein